MTDLIVYLPIYTNKTFKDNTILLYITIIIIIYKLHKIDDILYYNISTL